MTDALPPAQPPAQPPVQPTAQSDAPAAPDFDVPPHLRALKVPVVVSVGEARLTVEELMALSPETVVPLTARIDDPVTIHVGERLYARGELVETDEAGGLGVRIVELVGDGS